MVRNMNFLRMIIAVLAVLLLAGCSSTGSISTTNQKPQADTATPAPSANASAADSAEATELVTEAPKETEAVFVGTQDISKSPIFKYYNAVTLGMTKDEADAAIGLAPKEDTGKYAVKNSFNYYDGDGYGVFVIYNDEMKAYSKTAVYKKASELAPFTAKPVTADQKNQIEKGAAHDDVVKLLGGDGIVFSITADEKDPNMILGYLCLWVNENGSYLQVAFTGDDKVSNVLFREEG